MASSRWKRFPFFDRRNLSLPLPVVRDLVPGKGGGGGGGGVGGGGDALDPHVLYRDDEDDGGGGGGEEESPPEDRARVGIGGYFSLVAAANVALPSSLFASGGRGDDDQDDDEDDEDAGGSVGTGPGALATRRGAGGDGAPAMRAGLAALRDASSSDDGGSGGGSAASTTGGATAVVAGEGGGDGELCLLFASSRNTSLVHCVDVTARCTPPDRAGAEGAREGEGGGGGGAGRGGGGGGERGSDGHPSAAAARANPEELDGWRGRYDPFASCDGFSSGRREVNLLGGGSSATVASPSPKRPTSAVPSASKGAGGRRGAAERRVLDEHMDADLDAPGAGGGGGSLFGASPFAEPPPPAPPAPSPARSRARVVGLACCSSRPASNEGDSTILYVAAVTDAPGSPGVVVHANPHLALSSLPPSSPVDGADAFQKSERAACFAPPASRAFDVSAHGKPRCVSILPGVVAVGTDAGAVLLLTFRPSDDPSVGGRLAPVAEIPPPRAGGGAEAEARREGGSQFAVERVELIAPAGSSGMHRLFVAYRRRRAVRTSEGPSAGTDGASAAAAGPSGGVCCYDLGGLRISGRPSPPGTASNAPVVSARYDVDGRDVASGALCDVVVPAEEVPSWGGEGAGIGGVGDQNNNIDNDNNDDDDGDAASLEKTRPRFAAARPDGLHLYAPEEKAGVCPVDGRKVAACALPPPPAAYLRRPAPPPPGARDRGNPETGGGAGGGGGGGPVRYRPEDVTALYRRHAEHLYRRGDHAAAMDQYVLTIGSLEPSHVVFRYLDAPKIPQAVRYLEALRAAGLAGTVHDELLRTCYLKLGDVESASRIVLASSSSSSERAAVPREADGSEARTISVSSRSGGLLARADDPSEVLAAICALPAPEAAEALAVHGARVARSLPRETAGVVVALCDGTFAPADAADAAAGGATTVGGAEGEGAASGAGGGRCDRYPVSLFANAFLENPRLLRLVLAHCRRNDRVLTPSLRRTLLELTLDEWSAAQRTGDSRAEKLRHDEAVAMLSESHLDDMGHYESLVIVQAAGFTDGEVLLYERLNEVPMLLEEYARSGTDVARRKMLALCERGHDDPDLLAEVLAHFVAMAGRIGEEVGCVVITKSLTFLWRRLHLNFLPCGQGSPKDEVSVDSESDIGGLLHDIHEALAMAREDHGGDLPPVRVLRILAGEGHGMFKSDKNHPSVTGGKSQIFPNDSGSGVPLATAMDYVGAVLDESTKKIHRLKSNVEEYSQLCDEMELEINALMSPGSLEKNPGGKSRSHSLIFTLQVQYGSTSTSPFLLIVSSTQKNQGSKMNAPLNINIDEMYSKLCGLKEEEEEMSGKPPAGGGEEGFSGQISGPMTEDFWRDMENSDDPFETICFYISKGYLESI
ncbi:hypothetical protein ACHAWF_014291 [Thalassiosira exigua]